MFLFFINRTGCQYDETYSSNSRRTGDDKRFASGLTSAGGDYARRVFGAEMPSLQFEVQQLKDRLLDVEKERDDAVSRLNFAQAQFKVHIFIYLQCSVLRP